MDAEQAVAIARRWQQSSLWDVAKELARVLMTEETNEAAAMKYAHTLQELHGQLVTLQELVRRERPDCLHLISPVDFLREYTTLDVPGRIRDLLQLEGLILSDSDPWTSGYTTAQWVESNKHRHFTSKTMETLRHRAKADGRLKDCGNGRGPWSFRLSFCRENDMKCPDIS